MAGRAGSPSGDGDPGRADRKRNHCDRITQPNAVVDAAAAGTGWPDASARRWIALRARSRGPRRRPGSHFPGRASVDGQVDVSADGSRARSMARVRRVAVASERFRRSRQASCQAHSTCTESFRTSTLRGSDLVSAATERTAVEQLDGELPQGPVVCVPQRDVGPHAGAHSGEWVTPVRLALHPNLVEVERADQHLASELRLASA